MTEPTFEKEHVRSINERIRRMARERVFGRMPSAPGSISLRSTEPLRVSSADAVTIPLAGEQ
jgi:hypothetical protein